MVEDAIAIDKKNGNIHWQDALEKEMENVKITVKIVSDGERPPDDYQCVDCHMVFDIKMEDFWRNSCLVVQSHITHTPDIVTYFSVIMRETVCIALPMVVLHDLEVKATDVLNAYVTAPNREKIWTVIGQDFGNNAVSLS